MPGKSKSQSRGEGRSGKRGEKSKPSPRAASKQMREPPGEDDPVRARVFGRGDPPRKSR